MPSRNWDKEQYYGRYNRWPFNEVVSFVMRRWGSLANRKQIKILDLGFGGAHHLVFLASEGFDFYGIDGSKESLEIATERLNHLGYTAENLVVGTFDELPYTDDFFDCVIDRGSLLCNRRQEIIALLPEIRRVLKPGGWLFSAILNELSTAKQGATDLGNNDYTDFPGRLAGAGVLHFTNASDAQEIFSEFEIEDIELMVRKSEYGPAQNAEVDAWTLITCQK
jgi:ubiquinone/menaquinone biosynthesis C-methylase UbiE